MINVNLNTNIGKGLLSMLFGLQVAVNNLNARMLAESKTVEKNLENIQKQKPFFDMRYKQSKEFFANPMDAKNLPVIKKTQIKILESKTTLIYRNKERILGYNSNIEAIKTTALYKGIRRSI